MMATEHTIALKTGKLSISVLSEDMPLDKLCDFAARINPKRGFLFVSKVLGRYVPVTPTDMNAIYDRLADKIGELPQPVLFFGFAETAIALSYGVYRSWERRHGNSFFVHSTRYVFENANVMTTFTEPHSHAPDHVIYTPNNEKIEAAVSEVKSIVLIDDECTSGNTLRNAVTALKDTFSNVEKIVPVVLTHWGVGSEAIEDADIICLLKGDYNFEAQISPQKIQMPNVTGSQKTYDSKMPRNDGRFFLDAPIDVSKLFSEVKCKNGERIVVVGTGEFVTVPFLLAEYLEKQGAKVSCLATSRSPIFEGNAIHSKQIFEDRYGDNMPNFIYNLNQSDFDRILVCYESPIHMQSCDPNRLGNLSVESVFFG